MIFHRPAYTASTQCITCLGNSFFLRRSFLRTFQKINFLQFSVFPPVIYYIYLLLPVNTVRSSAMCIPTTRCTLCSITNSSYLVLHTIRELCGAKRCVNCECICPYVQSAVLVVCEVQRFLLNTFFFFFFFSVDSQFYYSLLCVRLCYKVNEVIKCFDGYFQPQSVLLLLLHS